VNSSVHLPSEYNSYYVLPLLPAFPSLIPQIPF
jgi:hypothetical protein